MTRTSTLSIALVMVTAMLPVTPAVAHHNFVTQFDTDKPVTLRGTVAKMDWINPHGWILIDVRKGEAEVERWAVETGNPARMEAQGLKKDDFRQGTEIMVVGFASRKGSPEAAGFTVTFPDRQASFLLGR
jgi:hypothetical protein